MPKLQPRSQTNAVGIDYGIQRRVDHAFGGPGWEVQASGESPKSDTRYFSDIRYGTSGRALATAMGYRDRLLRKNGMAEAAPGPDDALGGVVEVSKYGQVLAYTAESRLPSGAVLSKTFRAARRGPAAARMLAVAERKNQLVRAASEMLPHVVSPQLPAEPTAANESLDLREQVRVATEIQRANIAKAKGIHRLPEGSSAGGWRVLVRRKDCRISRFFLDRDFDGAIGAWARAVEFREQL
ncbi:hypothetical protein [Lysobacter antibioticus]|uniref:Uncharacterized protein n=1 Tax=Lysobacter antibioticus TaxID=84531 RepID=A0A0S2FHZ4_LYSAN|nr:hypothetical protein [Lysobacter antibioticus]ALN83089.1 hypothetical protein LA76x_4987 [Lysobacter antibioticus]